MEARSAGAALLLVATFFSLGASHRTTNFIVTAKSPQISAAVAQAAEQYRKQLAVEWLGHELPAWRQPCPIEVHVGPQYGAGGATSFRFQGREPIDWTMTIHGTYQRVLDSVLPHEVTHTIFATHFGRPLPRWADEGACTTVEHVSERSKQQNLLIRFLSSDRGIPFNSMFTMTEYPRDMIPLYSQGHSVARYLIMQGGKQKFIKYVWDGMGLNHPEYARMHYGQKLPKQEMIRLWTEATKKHYGFQDLSNLQVTWLTWVKQGRPQITAPPAEQIASTEPSSPTSSNPVADFDPAQAAAGPAATQAAPSQAAARTIAAAPVSDDGWYHRRAREARQARTKQPAQSKEAVAETPAAPYQPGSIRGAPVISISRVPAPSKPKQTVILWGN